MGVRYVNKAVSMLIEIEFFQKAPPGGKYMQRQTIYFLHSIDTVRGMYTGLSPYPYANGATFERGCNDDP